MLRIDHVIRAVRDLDAAGRRLLDEHGLASAPGGRHLGMGTANRVVPLGNDYLELIGVVDEAEAATSPLGRWVAAAVRHGDRWAGWVVSTDELDGIAAERGLDALEGSRERPDGTVLRWRMAGVERAMTEPPLPFFIEWVSPEADRPGRAAVVHPARASGIARLDLSGDGRRLREWLGDAALPLRVVEGPPGLRAVVLATGSGELRLTDR